jgi:hypothetical protein
MAENTLREIGRVTLVEALQLTALIAVKDPRRHARVSARWLAPRPQPDRGRSCSAARRVGDRLHLAHLSARRLDVPRVSGNVELPVIVGCV